MARGDEMKKPVSSELDRYRRLTRVGLGASLVLGLLLLVQAMAWAQVGLKSWQDGDTLTAGDLNANFDAVRAQMLTKDSLKFITATLEPETAAANGGYGQPVACGDGFELLSYGLTRIHHTQAGTGGWDLGGMYGCVTRDTGLVAYLEEYDYAEGTPNTRIECTGLCVRVAAP
jgi:hypothetical protein